MTINLDENIISLIVSIIALAIAIIALIYTVRTFLLKSGQKFRCDIGTTNSFDSTESYISSITLENLKDKAAVIFSIYVRYGLNNYLLIEEFGNSPLILKPFEVYYKEYDPVLFYSLGTKVAKIEKFIQQKNKVKTRIIIATTRGKYVVKYNTKNWDPIIPFFKNYYTAIIKPIRQEFKNKHYGDNIKFLVVLTHKNEQEQVIGLSKDDYKYKRFSKFQITKESLETERKLELFLKKQKKEGKLSFEKIEIINYSEIVDEIKSKQKEIGEIEAYNFFYYKILGKILTIREKIKMKIRNQRIKKKQVIKKTETELKE